MALKICIVNFFLFFFSYIQVIWIGTKRHQNVSIKLCLHCLIKTLCSGFNLGPKCTYLCTVFQKEVSSYILSKYFYFIKLQIKEYLLWSGLLILFEPFYSHIFPCTHERLPRLSVLKRKKNVVIKCKVFLCVSIIIIKHSF